MREGERRRKGVRKEKEGRKGGRVGRDANQGLNGQDPNTHYTHTHTHTVPGTVSVGSYTQPVVRGAKKLGK